MKSVCVIETEKQYTIVSIQEVNVWLLWMDFYDETSRGKQHKFVKENFYNKPTKMWQTVVFSKHDTKLTMAYNEAL